jgi:hypothetical protein
MSFIWDFTFVASFFGRYNDLQHAGSAYFGAIFKFVGEIPTNDISSTALPKMEEKTFESIEIIFNFLLALLAPLSTDFSCKQVLACKWTIHFPVLFFPRRTSKGQKTENFIRALARMCAFILFY